MSSMWLKPRFSLRVLFVITTAAAVLCYFLWPQNGGITEAQVRALKLGMYPDEVAAALDRPPTRHAPEVKDKACGFPVAGPLGFESESLLIEFGGPNGTVSKIIRRGQNGFAFPW